MNKLLELGKKALKKGAIKSKEMIKKKIKEQKELKDLEKKAYRSELKKQAYRKGKKKARERLGQKNGLERWKAPEIKW